MLVCAEWRAWVEACHLSLDIVHLSAILRQHILHRVHLVRILQHLPDSTTVSSLVSILIAHGPEVHIVLHIGQIRHILEIVHAVEIIIALIHLHIIIAEALGHLILIKLGKLLLIWHKILIWILGAIWRPLVWKLLGIGIWLLDHLSYAGRWALIVILTLALAWLRGICVRWDLVLLHGKPDDINWNWGWHLGLVWLRQKMWLWALTVQVVAREILVPDIVLMTGKVELVVGLRDKLRLLLNDEALVLVVCVYWIVCRIIFFALRWAWLFARNWV